MFPGSSQLNLANAITVTSIVAAAAALSLAAHGQLALSLCVGAITLPCDVLDGVVARRRNTVSRFGAELDSLCDAIAFGVLPALLGYVLGVRGPWVIVLVLYVVGTVWRLARFAQVELSVDEHGRQCFEGVPTTFCAAVFYVISVAGRFLPSPWGAGLLCVFFAAATLCMNAAFSFPKRGIHTRALWVLVPLALIASLLR